MPSKIASRAGLTIAGLFLVCGEAQSQIPLHYVGNVVWIEVWKSGNVAFTMSTSIPCNGQLILNKSDPGFKNQYAALLAAKAADKPIRAYVSGCIPPEGVSGPSYAEVAYLYID